MCMEKEPRYPNSEMSKVLKNEVKVAYDIKYNLNSVFNPYSLLTISNRPLEIISAR